MCYRISLGLAIWAFLLPLSKANATTCRYLPGDDGWPSSQEWAQLNVTVQGRLIMTIPLGAPCHDPTYNATECFLLQEEWPSPPIQ
jgi:hypothetical protein